MTPLEKILIDRERIANRTRTVYLAAVRRFLAFAGVEPANWRPVTVKAWRDEMARRMSPQSANVHLCGLKKASKLWAKFERNDDLDFAEPVELLKVTDEAEGARALSKAEANQIIDACRGPTPINLRDTAMIVLGFRTGMRRMSLNSLDVSHYDPATRKMKIWLKGGKWHTMPPLDDTTVEALDPWLAWLRTVRTGTDAGMFRRLARRVQYGSEFHFVGPRLTLAGINLIMAERAEKAGVPDFSPHAMRHSFVTWMQEQGAPWDIIAAWTGHTSPAMAPVYTDAAKVIEARGIKLSEDIG